MKTTLKKIIAALSSAAVILQLSACGGADEPSASSAEYAYKAASAEVTEELKGEMNEYYGYFDYSGGRVCFLTEYNDPDPESFYSEYYLNSMNPDGSDFKSVKLEARENAGILAPKFGSDGLCRFIMSETDSEDNASWSLKTITADGAETASADITEIVTKNFPDGFFPNSAAYDGEENIYFADYSVVLVLDKNGGFVSAVNSDEQGISRMFTDQNGKVYASLWTGSEYEISGIDIAAGQLESPIVTPFTGYNNTYASGGDGYDFYVSDGTSLFGWNIGGEPAELLQWVKSGVSIMEVKDIFYIGNETFLTAGISHPHGYPKVSTLTKQLVNMSGKKEITVAGGEYSIDSYIENQIIKFNNASDKYYVTLKKYPYGENGGTEQLNLDLTAGRVPDVLITDSYTPIDSYISKGMFADMYEFIGNDSEISRDDFLPNLLAACETDGKLYRFTDCFSVYTVIGKTSFFGEDMGITVDRLNSLADKVPKGERFFEGFSKASLLRYAMQLSGDEFINRKKGTCSFNSESFLKMLEFADGCAETDLSDYFDDSFWASFDTMFSDGSARLMAAYLTDYSDIYNFEHDYFGEKVTALGFPCENRIGSSFDVSSGFSISEKSRSKEGAWEFVRTLLLPEYQDVCGKFPVRKDSLEKLGRAAMKYNPKKVYSPVVMMGDMTLSSSRNHSDDEIPGQEDIDRMNEIIASANGLMSFDSAVMDIVDEEAGSYFSGSKSAKEAADLIQTRVQLYLDENA